MLEPMFLTVVVSVTLLVLLPSMVPLTFRLMVGVFLVNFTVTVTGFTPGIWSKVSLTVPT